MIAILEGCASSLWGAKPLIWSYFRRIVSRWFMVWFYLLLIMRSLNLSVRQMFLNYKFCPYRVLIVEEHTFGRLISKKIIIKQYSASVFLDENMLILRIHLSFMIFYLLGQWNLVNQTNLVEFCIWKLRVFIMLTLMIPRPYFPWTMTKLEIN